MNFENVINIDHFGGGSKGSVCMNMSTNAKIEVTSSYYTNWYWCFLSLH